MTSNGLQCLMEGPHVKRGAQPQIKLSHISAATPEVESQIKGHITNLTKIDGSDFGLSGTLSGIEFAPVSGNVRGKGDFPLTEHELKTSNDFRQLVALGPQALPFLFEHLDDKTPTKLRKHRDGSLRGMYPGTEMGSNPTNTIEQNAVTALFEQKATIAFQERSIWFGGGGDRIGSPATVGDVSMTIVGQIVGRSYVRVWAYPTTLHIAVEESALAKAVRNIWSSTNATERFLDSLLFDYATEGIFNGESLDGWDIASELQCQAALRMLYYFPNQTAGLIADRLAQLDVRVCEGDVTNFIHREVSNGVRTKDFIKAVAWSDEPSIRRELLNIFKRTTDPEILLAALIRIDMTENKVAKERLNEKIGQLPAEEPGPCGVGYNLLVALGNRFGAEAKPTFTRYLQNASLQRWRSMARVLLQTHCEWAEEMLSPALADKREFGWTYALVAGQNEPRRPVRVCDEVAETISRCNPGLAFKLEGEQENLDRQIEAIRERIAGNRP